MIEYEYFLAEDNDFGRLFRLPVGADGPVEIYEARKLQWETSEWVKTRAHLQGTEPISDCVSVNEMRICQLIVRAAKRYVDTAVKQGILTYVSSQSIYANN